MSVPRFLIPLAVALVVAQCSDRVGPPSAADREVRSDQQLHFLRWTGTSSPHFTVAGALPGRPLGAGGGPLRSRRLSLQQYTASFWAVRGEQRSIHINYISATGDTSWKFLRLTASDPTYAPGIGDLAPGDSVLITVTIDTVNVKVSLEPSGLVFGNPARLQISYNGADGDLNGDGVVDDADTYIESQLLGIWYREGAADGWEPVPAVQSLSDKSFTSALPHFCEYAVSW